MITQGMPESRFMPIYKYLCTKCGWKFKAWRASDDPPSARCPKCGKATTRRK